MREEVKKAYDAILNIVSEYRNVVRYSFEDLEKTAKLHLFAIELKEKYGLNIAIGDVCSFDYIIVDDYRRIGRWGKEYHRTISCPDDGRQPEDEILLAMGFPTGAYIFGDDYSDDYPTELFDEFFNEIKAYKPDYLDSTNHNVYFKLENAEQIFNDFPEILKRYHEKNKIASKQRKIEKLQKQITALISENSK